MPGRPGPAPSLGPPPAFAAVVDEVAPPGRAPSVDNTPPGPCTTVVNRVLVTRPAQQAADWVCKLRAQGLPALALPLLGIEAAPDAAVVRTAWQAVAAAARLPGVRPQLMFVSPNAAQCFFQALAAEAMPVWPAGVRALATGPGTVAALRAAGVPAGQIVAPAEDAPRLDSEALWACVAGEAWTQQPTWVVRGEGGRDWLASTLRQAGAPVAFVQAYARSAPVWQPADAACFTQAWADPQGSVWLISSSEALDHLPALQARHAPAGDARRWADTTAVASHPRIADNCRRFGFGQVLEVRPAWEAVLHALRTLPGLGGPGPGAEGACLQSGRPSPDPSGSLQPHQP